MSCPEDETLAEGLPIKSRSLRAKSIAKRLETERNKNAPRVRKPRQKVCTMSKYRRKTANAKERDRMKQVNDAFEKLREVVPHHRAFIGVSTGDPANATKVSTLRCAISYINSLQQLIDDSNKGLLDPKLYNTDLNTEEQFLFPAQSSKKPPPAIKKSGGKKGKKNAVKDSKSKKSSLNSSSVCAKAKKRQRQVETCKKTFSTSGRGKTSFNANVLQENLISSYLINPSSSQQVAQQPNPAYYKPERPLQQPSSFINPSLLPLQPLYLPSSPVLYKTPDSLYGDMDSFSDDVSSASPGSNSSSSSSPLEMLLQPLDFSSNSSEDLLVSSALNNSSSYILDDIQQILKEAENFDIMV